MVKIVETWQLLTVFAKHESKRSMIFISVKPVITFFNIYPNIISASRCHAWESNTTLAVSIVIFCSIFNTLEGRRRDRQCMGSLWWGGGRGGREGRIHSQRHSSHAVFQHPPSSNHRGPHRHWYLTRP